MIKNKLTLLTCLFVFSLAQAQQSPTVEPIEAPKKTAAKKAAKKAPKKIAKPAKASSAQPAATPASAGPTTDQVVAAASPDPAVPTPSPVAETKVPAESPAEAAAVPLKEDLPAEKPVPQTMPKEEVQGYGKTSRPLGDFLVGPYVQALGLLRPFGGGLEIKYADIIGLSGNYTFMPELKISSVKLKVNGWDARFKIYPFKGAFFLGVAYGSQDFTGSLTQTISGINGTATIHQTNNFLTPHIGWNWIWGSGFFMGMDLGVQLSMSRKTDNPTTDITNATVLASAEYARMIKDVRDKADLVGKTPLPLLTLIKFGYLF